jgi:hypothetical protein
VLVAEEDNRADTLAAYEQLLTAGFAKVDVLAGAPATPAREASETRAAA